MKKYNKGFTLIELLVVIAIIGILAAVILVSLGNSRSKGKDAAIKSQMNSMRTQAELYYSSNINSYASICTTAQTSLGFGGTGGPGLLKAVKDSSMSGTPNTDIATPGAWNLVTCHDSATAWAVEAPLSTSTSGSPIMFCVDNLKAPKQETTNLTINTGAHPYDCQ